MILPIRDLVRDAIVNALAEKEGDKASAAMALGISLKTLYNHIHRNALEGEYKVDFLLEDGGAAMRETAEGAHRVRKIVEGLRQFARMDGGTMAEADVNTIIEQSLTLVWN